MYGLAGNKKNERINTRNKLGYILGQVNGGPWRAVTIYPKGIIVDPSSGRREQVVIYGGANLTEYRTSITFAPIADKLVCCAGQFVTKVWFDGRFLVAKVIKGGVAACGKIYLEKGISWADVLEQIAEVVYRAQDNYWRMAILCYKILDGHKTYVQAASANIGARSFFVH